jgi:hypothetical protein
MRQVFGAREPLLQSLVLTVIIATANHYWLDTMAATVCYIHCILEQTSVHGLASFGGHIIVGLETGEVFFDHWRPILSTCFHQGSPFQ